MTAPTSSTTPNRSPGRYFALVTLLTVPFWVLGAVAREPLAMIGLPLSALMFVSPLAAAVILIHREEGGPGLRRLLGSFVEAGQINWRWWLAAWLLMPSIYALSYVVHKMMGRDVPEPEATLLGLVGLLVLFLVTAACEEAGWTGYATDPLQERRGALVAALLIGVVWAGLHVVPDLQGGRSWEWIAGQRSFSVALRVLIVWLYNNTGRTLLAPTIMHATDNVSVFTGFPSDGEDGYQPAVTAAITATAAVIISVRWGWRTLADRRR